MDTFTAPLPLSLDGPQAGVLLDGLGGTVAVSRLAFTPITTVHNWRRVGMSEARFDHIRLAARARGKVAELTQALAAIGCGDLHAEPSAGETTAANSGKAEISAGEVPHG